MVAAVDLGSNSFHMVIARVVERELHIVDRLREPVRLAAGLTDDRLLDDDAQRRALECLTRFGQRLKAMRNGRVRAVGTNTLRQARDARRFLERAARAIGHPIEVVSGREEARLIYLGVAHTGATPGGRRLVVDIGGGSTECILGEGFDLHEADSLYMGCVSWSLRFFERGIVNAARMARATLAASQELQPIVEHYRAMGWDHCIGSSGTILAVAETLRTQGWSRGGITAKGLERLRAWLMQRGKVGRISLEGLKPERAPVIPGGVAILSALFEGFGIRRMTASPGALREGVLYDLLGRIRHEDVRDRTIRGFSERYQTDREHAARIERTALALLAQVAEPWGLADEEARQRLVWAARLHEVGLAVSYSGYHKHGAYLIAHSDMPGFSRDDQAMLAALVRCHRRKVPREAFAALGRGTSLRARRLCLLLRLAVLLNRSRRARATPAPRLEVPEAGVTVEFPEGWLAQHPLTRADLEVEAAMLERLGLALVYR
jgi:exopolyphosphatase/guanosine-5'-triphosphate,3'-diphosphate pyrophosphatase